MKKLLFISVCCLFSCSLMAAEETLHGTVTEVVDGNTILIRTHEGEEYKVYLHGIDSPEPGQEYAEQSKKLLERLLLKKKVSIAMNGKDRLGNRLGIIQVDGAPDPRHELVKAGLAWPAEKNTNTELESMKETAKASSLGLWQQENPTPPWVYRRQQTMLQSKSS